MKRFVIKEPHDVVVMLLRRKWWVLLIALPLVMVAGLVSILLPSVYVSETLVLVEPKDVPDDVVKDFVTADTQERLDAIQQTALSRSNLVRLLNELPDGFRQLRAMPESQAIAILRSRINIEITTLRRARDTTVPYFRISYGDRSPAFAQKVTERLATFFIDKETQTRTEQVFGTTDFLRSELEKVGNDLANEESQLAVLKERYRYELPEQLDANLRTIDRLQEQLKANVESRDRTLSLRYDLERRISETSPVINREQARMQQTGRPARAVSPLVQQYRQKELEVSELLSKYTDRHPDVVRAKSELERLKNEIPPEDLIEASGDVDPGSTVVSDPNPTYQQLTSQLAQVTTELKILDDRRKRIEDEITIYQRRIDATPQREQEIAGHQRIYESLMARYQDLESKLTQARLASSLESRQKGEQFQVVDAASFPLEPAKPKRLLVLLAGLGIALGVGLVVGVAVDFLDQKIWSASEVTELLVLPVLGEIPEILSPADIARIRRKTWIQAGAYAGGVVLSGAAVLSVYLTAGLRSAGTETLARYLGW